MESAEAVGLKDSGAAAAGIPITYRGVTKTYGSQQGSVTAVQDVSAEVGAAEFVSLVGPSGCGKTTLLMMTAGLKSVSRGEILVGDRRVQGPQTDCGVVFQDPTLLPWRNVLDNVMLQIEYPSPRQGAVPAAGPEPIGIGWSRGLRGQLSARALRRYAPARQPGPSADPRAAAPADGRALSGHWTRSPGTR